LDCCGGFDDPWGNLRWQAGSSSWSMLYARIAGVVVFAIEAFW